MMKRFTFLAILIFITLLTKGNIATPRAFISELVFDSLNNWTLEIGFYEYTLSDIDSIQIITSTGSSIVTYFELIEGKGYPGFDSLAVISNSNLLTPLIINHNGDFIKLVSYAWGDKPYDYVAFGNYEGSILNCIKKTESISYQIYIQSAGFSGSFGIDKSPTIGMGNDTIGAIGTFSGKIYDPSGSLFTEVWFPIPEIRNGTIHINPDGAFNERLFSRNYNFDTIEIRFPPWPYTKKKYSVEPMNFCLRPDSTIRLNFITKSLITGIEVQECDLFNVFVSPNPFKYQTVFYFNFNNEIIHYKKDIRLLIYSLNGEKLADIKIPSTQSKYNWFPKQMISPGVLIYNLGIDNIIVAKGKFIKQ